MTVLSKATAPFLTRGLLGPRGDSLHLDAHAETMREQSLEQGGNTVCRCLLHAGGAGVTQPRAPWAPSPVWETTGDKPLGHGDSPRCQHTGQALHADVGEPMKIYRTTRHAEMWMNTGESGPRKGSKVRNRMCSDAPQPISQDRSNFPKLETPC